MSYKQLGGVNVFSSMSKIKTNDLVTENLFTKMLEIDGEMFITNSKSGVNDVLVFEGIGDEEWKFVLDNSDNSNMTLTSKENNRTFKISNNNSTNDIISFNGGGDGIQAYKDIDMCYNSITNITNISSGPTRGNILFSDKDIGGNTKNFFLNDNRDFTCLVAGSHPGTKLTISNRPLYFGNWNHAFGRTILDFDTNLSQNWNNPTIANRPASSRIESVSLRKDDYEQGALNFWNTWEVIPGGGGGGSDGIMELMMTMTNKTIIHSDLDMSNNRIIDLSDGIQPSDAVTLRQLNTKLDLSGGEMLSDLDMSNNRIIDLSDGIQPSDAVTLRQLNTKLDLSGGEMLSELDMSNNRIIDLSDGIQPSDAVTLRQLIQLNDIITESYDISDNDTIKNTVVTEIKTINFTQTITSTLRDISLSFTYTTSPDNDNTTLDVEFLFNGILLGSYVESFVPDTLESRIITIESVLPPSTTSNGILTIILRSSDSPFGGLPVPKEIIIRNLSFVIKKRRLLILS